VGLSVTETWDSVTAPSIPSGWNVSDAAVVTENTAVYSGTNALSLSSPGGSQYFATYATDDGTGSSSFNLSLSGVCRIPFFGFAANFAGIAFRGSSSTLSMGTNCYVAYMLSQNTFNGDVFIFGKVTGSTLNQITTVVLTSNWGTSGWYTIGVSMTGNGTSTNSINLSVIRASDGFYLDSSGNFGSSFANVVTSSDTSILTGGYSGVMLHASASGRAVCDTWTLSSSPAGAGGLILVPMDGLRMHSNMGGGIRG
jgi:hypothetical protein